MATLVSHGSDGRDVPPVAHRAGFVATMMHLAERFRPRRRIDPDPADFKFTDALERELIEREARRRNW